MEKKNKRGKKIDSERKERRVKERCEGKGIDNVRFRKNKMLN